MRLDTSHLRFRHDILDWRYIFLLPAIILLQSTRTTKAETNQLLRYTLLSTVATLFAYRHNLSCGLFAFANAIQASLLYAFDTQAVIVFLLPITNYVSFIVLRSIEPVYTQCFTFVEFTIIVQPLIYNLLQICLFNWHTLFPNYAGGIALSEPTTVCLTCYTSLLVALMLGKVLSTRLQRTFCYLLFVPALLYGYLFYVLPLEPLTWLILLVFGNQTRVQLFCLWFLILAVTCLFAYTHTYLSRYSTTTTVTRKIFHFSISLVYLLGIKYDVQFLEFSSKLILFVFLYIEIIRLNDIYLISDVISQVFDRFRDEKDSGILTLTHIYLLIGCSAPLWLSSSSSSIANESKLLLASGVITVGIGDSFASIGGYYFGAHKWPNSSKSYEGTLCSFVSQLMALVLLHLSYVSSSIIAVDLAKFTFISLTSSLVETFTAHVDNLILPLIQYALILFLF